MPIQTLSKIQSQAIVRINYIQNIVLQGIIQFLIIILTFFIH